jgi:hypothetical protein
MATYGIAPRPRRANDLGPGRPEVELFARIEGLCGEEAALLAIPANERNQRQRDRLRAIAGDSIGHGTCHVRDVVRWLALVLVPLCARVGVVAVGRLADGLVALDERAER